jgi:hypothetical protein
MKPFSYHPFDLRQLVSFAEIARTGIPAKRFNPRSRRQSGDGSIRISANSRTISSTLRGREPIRVEGAVRLCNACKTTEEKLVLWTLLDTGLEGVRTARPDALNLLWQQKALRIKW